MSAAARRASLVQAMADSAASGKSCASCVGTCCTAAANSMQVTPLEALDLYSFLKDAGRLDDHLVQRLQETVRRYRLDHELPGDGRRTFLRRTYTCPFHTPGPHGCSVAAAAKPYGCLGFNPQQVGVTSGGACATDVQVQEAHAQRRATEQVRNEQLRGTFGLAWERRSIPVALLDLLKGANRQA